MKQKIKNQSFTLIEVMVTVAIFSLIFGIVSGLFASALKAQRRSLTSQELLAQTSYIMEHMSRHLRTARKSYGGQCGIDAGKSYATTTTGSGGIKFVNHEFCCWEFYEENNRLKRKITCSLPGMEFLTSNRLAVEEFNINLIEESGEQPRVTLFLKIRGNDGKAEEQPVIKIQSTISQRNLNVE